MLYFVKDIYDELGLYLNRPVMYSLEPGSKLDNVLIVGFTPPENSIWRCMGNYVLQEYYACNYLAFVHRKHILLTHKNIETSSYDNYLLNENEIFFQANVVIIVKQYAQMPDLSEERLKELFKRALYFLKHTKDISNRKYLCVVDFNSELVKKIIAELCEYEVIVFHPRFYLTKSYSLCMIPLEKKYKNVADHDYYKKN